MDYKVGDIVEYDTGSKIRRVKVTVRHAEVKYGQPGFDGSLLPGQPEYDDMTRSGIGPKYGYDVWGYDAQIVGVERTV